MQSSDGLRIRGQHLEHSKPLTLHLADGLDEDESSVHNDKASLDGYRDRSFRTSTAFCSILRHPSIQEIDSGSRSLDRTTQYLIGR
jgi:hypothetical protein